MVRKRGCDQAGSEGEPGGAAPLLAAATTSLRKCPKTAWFVDYRLQLGASATARFAVRW